MSKSSKSSSRTSSSRQDVTTTQHYLPREKKPPSSANRIDRPAVEAHTKKDRKDISLPNKNREIQDRAAVKVKAISVKNERQIKHVVAEYGKEQIRIQKISGDGNKTTVVEKQYEHIRASTVSYSHHSTTKTTNTTAQKFSQPRPTTFKTRSGPRTAAQVLNKFIHNKDSTVSTSELIYSCDKMATDCSSSTRQIYSQQRFHGQRK